MHLERLVLATDFSAAARLALEHAVAIATRFQARLYIFHAIDVRDGDSQGNESLADDFYELAERRAREELEALRARLGPPAIHPGPISIVETVRIGAPSDEIVGFAGEKEADLVVVGTKGRTGLARVLVGSVAESVVRRAPCPVLAVRVPESAAPPVNPPSFARIVCAVDSSDSSRAALRASCDLADRFDAEVVAVTVVDDYLVAQATTLSPLDAVALERRFVEIAHDNLERCVEETVGAKCGKGIRRRVETGRPAESIARAAELEGASLVACGTHGRSGIVRALFGSVAEKIVRLSPCPVLTVREGKPAARLAA
jgi:nucleotide-binding universal stress UspA family protein